jgi:hypothetical protein
MSSVFINSEDRIIVGSCTAKELPSQFARLKLFMQRVERGG